MKKTLGVLVLFFFLLLISSAYAHPPSDIAISFDLKTKILKVVIVHNVSNPLNHYINKVNVGLNGKDVIQQQISKQDNNNSQTVSYFIPDAKLGDIISVDGYCSISGKLKKEVTAGD